MRLLNVHSLQLHSFMDERMAPPYAILSHTWGDDELTFEDLSGPRLSVDKASQGVCKVLRCAEEAAKDALEYIWVDTCCIQKSSSAELTEAINSMFRWYQRSTVCYAYLSDVEAPNSSGLMFDNSEWVSHFSASRWFTRGWTLQELIAPKHLTFFSKDWEAISTKKELAKILFGITSIPQDTLIHGDTFGTSVSRRMSWAAKRQTTRIEDMAYCLLGLFDINMPLLYGEGSNAFQRLQEEIVKTIADETIFAWKAKSSTFATWRGLFAFFPEEFAESGGFVPVMFRNKRASHTITNRGHNIQFPLLSRERDEMGWSSGTEFLAVLRCIDTMGMRPLLYQDEPRTMVGICIKKIVGDEYVRVNVDTLCKWKLAPRYWPGDETDVIVRSRPGSWPWNGVLPCFRVRGFQIKNYSPVAALEDVLYIGSDSSKAESEESLPVKAWNPEDGIIRFDEKDLRHGRRQVIHCTFMITGKRSMVVLDFDPTVEYVGILCGYKVRKGKVSVEIESHIRVISGEAFAVVRLCVTAAQG